MKRISGVLISFAILGGIWALLFVVALVAGVIPSPAADPDAGERSDAGGADDGDASVDRAARDGGATRADASREDAAIADAGIDDAGDADVEPVAAPTGARLGATKSLSVGDAWPLSDGAPLLESPSSLAVGTLFEGARPTVAVTFDSTCHVFAVLGDGRLLRTHVIEVSESREGVTVEHGRPAMGDVTGDGRPDLVVAFWFRAAAGGSRGGGAWLFAGGAGGALAPPVRVGGQYMPQSIALADLDGRGGLELVIGDRGRPWGEQPSHVRVFRGGRRPSAIADRTSTQWSGRVALVDLDLDGVLDVVAYGNDETTLFSGGARGSFAEGVPLGVPSYRAVAADLDGDGHRDLVSSTRSMGWIRAGDAGRVLAPLSGTADFQPQQVIDANGDGREDVLVTGWLGNAGIALLDGRSHRLVPLAGDDPRASFGRLPQSGSPRRASTIYDAALADLDADGVLDLLAVVGEEDSTSLWVARSMPTSSATLRLTDRDIEDAPTTKHVALR